MPLKKECVPLKNVEIIAKLNLELKCALLSHCRHCGVQLGPRLG